MSQKSSVMQLPQFVPKALTSDSTKVLVLEFPTCLPDGCDNLASEFIPGQCFLKLQQRTVDRYATTDTEKGGCPGLC